MCHISLVKMKCNIAGLFAYSKRKKNVIYTHKIPRTKFLNTKQTKKTSNQICMLNNKRRLWYTN